MTYRYSNPHFRGCTIMMTVRRSFLAVRSFSTKRPGRSTKGDAAYESHMQAATVRHRRNRARSKSLSAMWVIYVSSAHLIRVPLFVLAKEKKKPDINTQPKRLSGRRERAPKSVVSSCFILPELKGNRGL